MSHSNQPPIHGANESMSRGNGPGQYSSEEINRRKWLNSSAAIAATSFLAATPAIGEKGDGTRVVREPDKRVEIENGQPGADDWQIQNTRIAPETRYRSPSIEGYASHASIQAGEKLELMISVAVATDVKVEIFRMGYYGGKGARKVFEIASVPCTAQETPTPGEHRVMVCEWPAACEVTIPENWLSGIYIAKLTEQREQLQSYIIFIVRDDRRSDLVFQCSDNTWQAYNRWPSQFSLYDDGKNTWHWGDASRVSYKRPYGKYCQILDAPLSLGSGEFFLWEYPFVYWLEQHGYDVSYISNTDTHRSPELIERAKGLLSVGHDEYWTIEMFRHVQRAVESGTSVGFFSGNAVCGRVDWNDQNQSMRRTGVFGPPGGMQEFQAMSSLKHERPYANELIGAHSTGPVTGGADWICTLPNHWIYEGTEMKMGDSIPGLIGWEYHGDPAPIEGLEIVARGPTQSAPGQLNGGEYTATVYPGPKGNFVFNASTCWWADGVSAPPGYQSPSVYTSPQGVDRRVQQITANILNRMIQQSAR